MIFASRNEKGELAADLVMTDKKTVTRRLKAVAPGKILAVQPGRTKKGIGFIRVISCMSQTEWDERTARAPMFHWDSMMRTEAEKEGFETWDGLMKWFQEHKVHIDQTFRIEFERVSP